MRWEATCAYVPWASQAVIPPWTDVAEAPGTTKLMTRFPHAHEPKRWFVVMLPPGCSLESLRCCAELSRLAMTARLLTSTPAVRAASSRTSQWPGDVSAKQTVKTTSTPCAICFSGRRVSVSLVVSERGGGAAIDGTAPAGVMDKVVAAMGEAYHPRRSFMVVDLSTGVLPVCRVESVCTTNSRPGFPALLWPRLPGVGLSLRGSAWCVALVRVFTANLKPWVPLISS